VVIATKADLALPPDPRAVLAVSVQDGRGLAALRGLLARRVAPRVGAEPRQQRLLASAEADVRRAQLLPPYELLADDLRRASSRLADLLGATTDDQVLDAVFARFCIGK
jgi:tRNA modification GTPase